MIETLIVMAKECVPGRVKTRLTPPFTPDQAARIAAASLADTLALGERLPVRRRMLCFDGAAPPRAVAFEVVRQPGGGLDERIAYALDQAAGPALVIGMDTPHASVSQLSRVVGEWPADVDAWLGPAVDGGFWALALRRSDGDLVRGVPMSRDDTGARQLARLRDAGLRVGMLDTLSDLDTAADLPAVVAGPHARSVRALMAAPEFAEVLT